MAAIVAVSCAASDADVWADHSATSCILHVRGESHPVTYLDAPRQNPDDTYYPGDAFYYIFRWEDRSDPGDCIVHAPLLETSRLLLDHHAVRVDGDGRMSRSAPLAHTDLDPAVGFLSSTDFYAGKIQTECQVSFAKPGESWRTKWEQWTVYDKVFLTKEGDDRLTEYEKTLKSKAYRGEPAWEWWEQKNKMRSGHPDLPECPFGLRPGGPGEPSTPELPELPVYMKYYGDGIFYATSYAWGIITNTNASHAHLAATPADPGSTEWFGGRVQELCGKLALPTRSGCVYGTAEIRPNKGVDSYARLLHAWHTGLPPYDITGKDGKPVAPPPGPPPGYPAPSWGHLLANRTHPFDLQTPPPGIYSETYEAPAAGGLDTCASPSSDGAKLELTAAGTYLTPHHYANGIPVKGVKKIERDEGPSLQDGELLIILSKPPLHHIQGYDAKNLDGTYYHSDPVYVRHEPSWKWKDERSAHINFKTHRLPPVTLPIIDEFDCPPPPPPSADENDIAAPVPHTVAPPCEHAVKVDSPPWLAERLWFGNGDGLTVRTAGTPHGFGTYVFEYNMTAYNLGKMVANATNSTAAEVVPYEPSYETAYSYPVLADAREYAFDDRHGIAMRYGGSWQEDVLHPMRRSFINGWDGTGGGHDPYTYNHFGQDHVFDAGRNSSPGHTALEHVQDTQTAMFVQSGHGTVLFEWPVSGWVFSTHNQTATGEPGAVAAAAAAAKAAVNENVTSHLQIYSRDFAGKDTLLYETTMRYPEMPFAKRVMIQSIDHSGAIQTADNITLRVTPYAELGAEYLTDYILDKITWDTDDPIVAQIVVNDTHSMVQEWHASGGMINAAILRTSIHFDEIALQNGTGLPFSGRLVDLHELTEHPETFRLTAPYDLGLSVLAPTSLHIAINGSNEHVIHHKYYSFEGSETVSINAQKDNPADVSREPGRIVIKQPENFGIIKHVEINGARLEQPCPIGCTVLFQPDTTLNVTLYNEWGGEARGAVSAPHVSNTPRADEPRWQIMGTIAILLVLSYVAYKKLTKKS
ncbi:MAG: hypothetical protein J4F28_08665 [Nitrosopumilaceae archaeon]|nr:hypothetical protein [Nitrosopumilaceae archaeon]